MSIRWSIDENTQSIVGKIRLPQPSTCYNIMQGAYITTKYGAAEGTWVRRRRGDMGGEKIDGWKKKTEISSLFDFVSRDLEFVSQDLEFVSQDLDFVSRVQKVVFI